MGESSFFLNAGYIPFLLLLIIGILVISSISGIYPYFWLKSKLLILAKNSWQWKPLLQSGKKIGINKTMTAIQYVSSIALISIIMIVTKQINYFMDNRLGKGQEKIICLKNVPVQVIHKYQVLKSQLLSYPVIADVTSSFEEPADEANDYMGFKTTGAEDDIKDKMLAVYPVDDNFFKFYHVKLIAGNNFPPYHGNDSLSENYILNKKALDYLGWNEEETIGRDFSLVLNTTYGTNLFNGGKIIGVVENFQMSSMKDEIKPYVFFQKSFWLGSIQVKYNPELSSIDSTLRSIKKVWDDIYTGFPFEYEFVENMYEEVYNNEIRLQKISSLLAIIAIIMSCLGLWAITGINYQVKTKEVGIRKTNGASSNHILFWFLKDIIIMIVLSSVIAFPIAYYIMQKWLENYANKIDLNWWIFLLAGLVTLIIALFTVIWQSFQIANKNPVEALRYE